MATVDIIKPNINAPTEAGQLKQIRTYLYQVSEQLNWALNTISTEASTAANNSQATSSRASTPEEVESNFNDIKSLIIKSADIVNKYYETIKAKLEGEYSALSEFGEFKQTATAYFDANPTEAKVTFENLEEIKGTLEGIGTDLDKVIENTAYITVGKVYDDPAGGAVYGLKIGQKNEVDGEEIFNQFATFTANRLSFYDSNGIEVAYVSDYELVITTARILGNLLFGDTQGYTIDTSDGVAFVWEEERKG